MNEILTVIDFRLINKLAFLTLILSMLLDTGLSLTIQQLWEPFRNIRLILQSLLANFIFVPLFVYLLLQVIPLSEPFRIGFTIMAVAGGPPVLPKLAQLVNGNLAYAAGLMMLMICVTAFYMPFALSIALQNIQVNPWQIVKPLVTLMLIPLAIGLLIRSLNKTMAATLQPLMRQISSVGLIVGLSTSLILQFGSLVVMVKTGVIFAIAIFIIVSFGFGYLLGGPNSDTRRTLAVGTAQRNMAAALLVAGTNFDDPAVVSVIVVTSLSLFVLIRLIAKQAFAVAEVEQVEV
ncbi:sodium:proton symporter [[Phormidium ambiguum] IAM M-71]|uniref:Sodium:proton symporter n=1 Tax=[Phormidium ambiguum] IAM M-71 TaxID=454136 RepID=A0A1U7I9V5_9CYAN|nr:bile acid:sodium symporter [Phormidium ambiguum]OKH33257.1 sodium:proton symporter [Phormidium ambiguum IAM M-71]